MAQSADRSRLRGRLQEFERQRFLVLLQRVVLDESILLGSRPDRHFLIGRGIKRHRDIQRGWSKLESGSTRLIEDGRRLPVRLSNASTHCLISISDAHSRSRMVVRWTGSAASTAALKTASIRFASTAMASFSETSSPSSASFWIAVVEKTEKTARAFEDIRRPDPGVSPFLP